MGVWGPGIFEDDIAADVQNEYQQLLATASDPERATRELLAQWNDAL